LYIPTLYHDIIQKITMFHSHATQNRRFLSLILELLELARLVTVA
jgi:hypothetical protein